MPTAGHPGPLSPRLPAIELTLPGDWSVDAGGEALFLATRAGGVDLAPVITAYVHTSREATTHDLVKLASNRKSRLVEHALSTRMVTEADLALLD